MTTRGSHTPSNSHHDNRHHDNQIYTNNMAYSSTSTSSHSSSSRSGGAAHRAVALDLMLRTFMNSPEFQPYNPRMWEGISKLVPGTTPHQCIQRWEELKTASRFIARDFSVLSAKGRPFTTSFVNTSHTHYTNHTHYKQDPAFTTSITELPPINDSASSSSRPPSSNIGYPYDQYRGSLSNGFTGSYTRLGSSGMKLLPGSFCQNYINRREREERNEGQETRTKERSERKERYSLSTYSDNILTTTSNTQTRSIATTQPATTPSETIITDDSPTRNEAITSNKSVSSVEDRTIDEVKESDTELVSDTVDHVKPTHNQLVIHVRDEAKKKSKDFICSRELLVNEMKYFKEYLSSAPAPPVDTNRQWDDVDISVHCDIGVFSWLMSYVKRGMSEGPAGEIRDTPLESPELTPNSVVSILISSDFLQMEKLVEQCLDYCHSNMTDVISSPANTGCIGSDLMNRLADRFSPLEVERLVDDKDKIKSKLYFRLLEKLFDATYSHKECPYNAATLYKCRQCGRLLTQIQETVFKCTPSRLSVDRKGQLVHKHERENAWSIDRYLMSLKDKGLTWRQVYWRLWGKVNWLYCTQCGKPFQCSYLSTCLYHPKPVVHVDGTGNKLPQGIGRYFCCSELTGIYSTTPAVKGGCQYKDHTHQSDQSLILYELRDVICEQTDQLKSIGLNADTDFTNSLSIVISKESIPKALSICLSVPRRTTSRAPSCEDSRSVKPTQLRTNNNNNHNTGVEGVAGLVRAQTETNEAGISEEGGGRGEVQERRRNLTFSHKKRRRDTTCITEEEGTASEDNSSSSELEEDEETEKEKKVDKPLMIKSNKCIRKTKNSTRILSDVDWVWDNSKPVRWNQDMQRSQDEIRVSQLQSQLKQLALATNHTSITTTSSSFTRYGTSSCDSSAAPGKANGGIYSLLEAQFFAQIIKTQRSSLKSNKRQQPFGKFK